MSDKRKNVKKKQECANQHCGAFSVSVKHNDRKETHEMIGCQLIERGEMYTKEVINNLPSDILNTANMPALKKKGSLVQNKLAR